MKWGPVLAMVLLAGIGLWIVWGPTKYKYGVGPRPGSRLVETSIGSARGLIEVGDGPDAKPVFRVLFRGGHASPEMSAAEFKTLYGEGAYHAALNDDPNPIFRIFKITSWTSLVWVLVGLGGQIAFSGRILVQWIISEKRQASVVPVAFWWMSLGGGAALFAYFAWRQDAIAMLGQAPGVVIYLRNLRLIYRKKSQMGEDTPEAGGVQAS